MENLKAVLSVRFESDLGAEELARRCEKYAPLFRDLPGLEQKYYLADPESGALSGFYVFRDEASREAYWNSDLAKGIPERYEVKVETLRIEKYSVSMTLNP